MFENITETTRTDPREPGLWRDHQRLGPPVRIIGPAPGGKLRIEVQHGGGQLSTAIVDLASEKSFADAGLYQTTAYRAYLQSIQP